MEIKGKIIIYIFFFTKLGYLKPRQKDTKKCKIEKKVVISKNKYSII